MIKSLNKIKELPLLILFLLFLFALTLSGNFNLAVTEGISLWFLCVVPTLFPYLFITTLLSSLSITDRLFSKFSPITKKLFRVNGMVGYAFALSLISGYPIGAKTISDLKLSNVINDAEAVRGSALCSTSSPVFLIGTVGGIMFNDRTFGLILFFIHILSASFTGFIFSFYKRKTPPSENSRVKGGAKSLTSLYDTAYSSVISILVVGALITIFYLLTEVLNFYGILSPVTYLLNLVLKEEKLAEGIVFGLFECTKGLKTLSSLGFSALPFTAFLCSFGGLSVIAQSVSFLKKAKIKTAPFILSKICSAVVALILGFIAISFF